MQLGTLVQTVEQVKFLQTSYVSTQASHLHSITNTENQGVDLVQWPLLVHSHNKLTNKPCSKTQSIFEDYKSVNKATMSKTGRLITAF